MKARVAYNALAEALMRLLQVMAGPERGGAEVFFERLTLALAASGVTQRCVIRRGTQREDRLREAHIQTLSLPFGGMFDFRTKALLAAATKEFAPEIVLSWMNRATRFCKSGPYVRAARLGGYYNLKYYRTCDHLIGNTLGIVDYIKRQGWPAEKTHYLPNFVSVEGGKALSRDALDIPSDAPLALALGRLHPNKGFDVLLHALAGLPKFYLLIAGEGAERPALEHQASQLGLDDRVRFLGWRRDVSSLLLSADMFICSSRYEPLGNMIIEAWASGTPVIAAASQGPVELIKDKVTGLLVPPNDADKLRDAMQALAENEVMRVALARAGRQVFEQNFTEKKVIALYRGFFDRVIS